jgi:hypothetical protein
LGGKSSVRIFGAQHHFFWRTTCSSAPKKLTFSPNQASSSSAAPAHHHSSALPPCSQYLYNSLPPLPPLREELLPVSLRSHSAAVPTEEQTVLRNCLPDCCGLLFFCGGQAKGQRRPQIMVTQKGGRPSLPPCHRDHRRTDRVTQLSPRLLWTAVLLWGSGEGATETTDNGYRKSGSDSKLLIKGRVLVAKGAESDAPVKQHQK